MSKKILLFVVPILAMLLAVIPMQTNKFYASTEIDNIDKCKASILIERNSNEILLENNSHEHLPIASVTKLMTILLTLEQIDTGTLSIDDYITVSSNASGMGGSQVFLDANQQYNVGELLKSVIVASANDSSVALAEHIAGSENNFVRLMNEKANELDLKDTNYVNCTGLPSTEGYSSAYDQAIILNKVLDYPLYHQYSSIWFEEFTHPSGRTTQMTNTNKLSRFYEGCIGGKTGSTNQAKYCLAVGAKRNDMELISVVLGAEDSKIRFNISSNLLNYGFDNFETTTLFDKAMLADKTVAIKGMDRHTTLTAERDFSLTKKKGEEINYTINYNLPNMLIAVNKGDVVGNAEIVVDGVVVDKIDILSNETYPSATIWDYIKEITKN